ncbi:hypothetical protein B7P43_G04706 [Cryptotermes secundus]|uniref:Tc1-like transposase DDE domain-containing protein n=1 Tax=Cryptotermes secundus TaxID=105785 RepID=A0A2J7Q668_9NEOP|nr:hypothetical protein B7P43_G04706 [Cryptotermes secundus]
MHYWSSNNPRELHERPLHSDKVTVWCVLSRVAVIGPYFFEEDNHAVIVNLQQYVDMIKNFFEPALEEMHLGNVWFQEDGATAHTARASVTLLRAKFSGWLISLRGDIPWAAHSPDLTPYLSFCNFYLWGNLKGEVYKNNTSTSEALQYEITCVISSITMDKLQKVSDNLFMQCKACLQAEGGHFQHLF